ncbi:hypothetical protein Q31b_32970 [Novipirellula aureliae]|uniref:Uncharacterized protein n=1 Tax=Novipirellula aureliae TaxID=2527966 RepID=A0A5C6DX70_9BACT|nr:hypothetical protein [Novipirellula aureliae]TWU39981.1 hypothetical protein Q31b_32970 [Novipirellula aureliae]
MADFFDATRLSQRYPTGNLLLVPLLELEKRLATRSFTCKTCDGGTMYATKMHRLSGPAVFIGYLILIPSVLGVLLGMGIGVLGVIGSAAVPSASKAVATETLTESGIDANLAERIVSLQISVDDPEIESLSDELQVIVTKARREVISGTAATGVGFVAFGGGAICFSVFCFMNGLIGWLLTMKKKVLQCSACRAIVDAS